MTRVKTAESPGGGCGGGRRRRADALGVVFAPGTPRYVAPDAAAEILAAVPPLVATVGVFLDHPLEEVLRIISVLGLHAVQLHGQEPAAYSRRIPVPVIRAVRVRDAASLQPLETYPAHAFLLDAYGGASRRTGTPISLDSRCRRKAGSRSSFPEACGRNSLAGRPPVAQPYGVDVSSGVEASPGRKDHRK
jgi:phosphoribosylanthranilate isomerase